ncbi:MAG: O-antigen ligase family protein, partial [Blastocatellia bacterium]
SIFFQLYVPVGTGKLNVNLADSVVLFGGALFAGHFLSRDVQPLRFRVPRLGIAVSLMTLVVVFAFVHGWAVDGWTAWASANRFFGWFVLLAYAGTGALIVLHDDEDGFRLLLRTFVVSGLAVAMFELILLFAVATGIHVPRPLLGLRIAGFAQNPNAFGFQLLLVIAAIFALRLAGWRHQISLTLALMALYFTASRGAEGTCILVFASAVMLRFVSPRSLAISVASAFSGVLAIFLVGELTALIASSAHGVLMSYFDTNVFQTTNINPDFKSNADRWLSLVAGLRMFLAHPIFGAGLGAFVASFERSHGEFLIIHSTPIWLLAETGIVGFAIFVAWYSYVLAREIRASLSGHPDSVGILLVLSLIAFGVMSQVHDLMYQRAFWFLLGATVFSRQSPLKLFTNEGGSTELGVTT